MSTAIDLDNRLQGLRADADVVAQYVKISNAAERRFYAATYVWWREARMLPDYLPQAFAAAGIKHNATRNKINWRPLLKLVTSGNISKTDLDRWSKSFAAMDAEYENDPTYYQHDPIGKLEYYVKVNGGKTGLSGYHSNDDDEDEADTTNASGESKPPVELLLFDLDDDEFNTVFLALANEHYGGASAIASITPQRAPRMEAERFSIALVRPDANDQSVISASTNNNLIDAVLVETYRDEFSATATSLRTVAEILHITNIPLSVSREAKRFVEYTRVQMEAGGKTDVRASKRLIYRSSKHEFLLSLTHVSSSVCVLAKPKHEIITAAKTDLLLPNFVRHSIEVRLLHQRMLNMFQPHDALQIPTTPQSAITHCSTPVAIKRELVEYIEGQGLSERTALKHIRNLRHPSLSLLPFYNSPTAAQVDANVSTYRPTWSAIVDQRWLERAVVLFFDQWIEKYAIKSSRTMNRVLSTTLTSTEMIIGYEFGSELGFSNLKIVPLAPHTATGSAALTFRSVDFAFVMKQLSMLPLADKIAITANDEMFSITCETEVNVYRIYVPSSNDAGERSASMFTTYAPTALAKRKSIDEAMSEEAQE